MHKVVYKAICKASCLLEAPKSIKKAPSQNSYKNSTRRASETFRAHRLPGSAQGPIQVATPGPLHDLGLELPARLGSLGWGVQCLGRVRDFTLNRLSFRVLHAASRKGYQSLNKHPTRNSPNQ